MTKKHIFATLAALVSACWFASAFAAPTLQNLTLHRGALTLTGAGSVPLMQFMQTGGDAVTGCTITDTSGTVGHWTVTATDCTSPSPTSAGVAAGLSAGPYTFSVVAHSANGDSAPATLTYTIDANAYTVSHPTEISDTSSGVRSKRASLGGQTIELARGSDAYWVGSTAQFSGFNLHAAGTYFTVQSEDTNNQTTIYLLSLNGVQRAIFQDFHIQDTLTGNTLPNNQSATKLIYISGTSSTSFGASGDLTFQRLSLGAAAGSKANEWPTGFAVQGSSTENIDTIKILDNIFLRVYNGITTSNAQNVTILRNVIDHFSSNAQFFSQNLQNLDLEDGIVVRPYVSPIDTGDHMDYQQLGSSLTTQNINNVYIRRMIYVVASPPSGQLQPLDGTQNEGTHPAQGPFSDDVSYTTKQGHRGLTVNNMDMQNVFADTSEYQGILFEAGSQLNMQRNTIVRGNENFSGFTNQPFINSHTDPTTGIFANNFALYDHTNLVSNWFPNVHSDNTLAKDWAAFPDWTNEAARAAYFSQWFQNPGASIDYKNMTAQQIAAAIKLAYASKPGSAGCTTTNGCSLMNPDGTYRSAFFPDGSWNDGSVYQAVAPTSYTITAGATTTTVGTPISVSIQLNGNATGVLNFTPHVSGGTATFTPAIPAISAGNAQTVMTFTPGSAGSPVLSFNNDGGLPDPPAINFTVTNPSTSPTTYTQTVIPTQVPIGAVISILYTLDYPATKDVTITPASQGQAGIFLQTNCVVQVGAQTCGVSFLAQSVATGNFTANNNAGLADPAPAAYTIVAVTKAQLISLGIR